VTSRYPVDVVWNGRTVTRAPSAAPASLPPGRHTVTLRAQEVALSRSQVVEARGGAPITLTTPPLGRLNVQARPDNCEVLIDGVFADYPPIRDRPLVVGPHQIEFRWPDGHRHEETVEVLENRPAFVTGRKQ
jgi:hypothetical protein